MLDRRKISDEEAADDRRRLEELMQTPFKTDGDPIERLTLIPRWFPGAIVAAVFCNAMKLKNRSRRCPWNCTSYA